MANVTPKRESVIDNGDGTFTAYFGYDNTYSTTQTISISNNNKFTPAPQDRGQPTSFLPGRQVNVFSVTWDGSNLVWSLDGATTTANASQSTITIESKKTITVTGSEYYICRPITALVWIKDPGVLDGDNLILMAVADPYGNVLNTDSSIKLELLREGNDFRLVYFSSQSRLINKSLGIDFLDGDWHFLSYECIEDGFMRYSIDGISLPASPNVDDNGLTLSQARSTTVRPGGGSLWTPYLYKAGQSISLYQLRFGVGFNLGLPWIRELMEIDKKNLRIQ
jgi:hypothetical protein